MKTIRYLYAAALFATALLLVALFVCTLKIGDLTGSGDLGSALGAVFALLLTFVPFVCFLPVAALLIVFCVLVLARGESKKVARASLIVVCIFLPILLFAVVIDGVTVAGSSVLFSAVLIAAAAAYCCVFGLSVAHFCMLRRAQKRETEGEA